MSNDPYTDGQVNSQPQSDTGAAPEWNGGYAPQQPQQQWGEGYAPQQQPDQGYQQQPPQQWNGGYAPQQPDQGYQQYGYQQAPYQGGYQQAKPPKQPRAPRTPNPAHNTVKLPRFVKKEQLPAIVKVLLFVFAGIMLLTFINNIANFNYVLKTPNTNASYYSSFGSVFVSYDAMAIIADLLLLGGAVCLVLSVMMKKSLLGGIGALVAGGGLLLASVAYFLSDPYSLRWLDIIAAVLFVFASAALILVGLNYLLHGRGINATFKRIACYAGLGCGVLGAILSLFPSFEYFNAAASSGMNYTLLYGTLSSEGSIVSGMGSIRGMLGIMSPTGTVLWTLFAILGTATLACALFLYNPELQVFQQDAPKSEKAPIQMWRATSIAKIMAIVFGGCALIALVFSIIAFRFGTFFGILLWLAAGVLMILGTMLSRKCEFFYAIGVFLAAASAVVFMLSDAWYVSLFLLVQVLCLVGIGFHYLFQNRVVSIKRKNLLTFIGLGIGAAACLFHIIMQIVDSNAMYIGVDAVVLIENIFILFAAVTLFLAILFYKPFSTPKAPKAYPGNGYQGGYPQNGYPQQQNGFNNGYPQQNGYPQNGYPQQNGNNNAAPY